MLADSTADAVGTSVSVAVDPASGGERELTLEIAEVRAVATDVIALTLVDPSGHELPAWSPGAHIDVEIGSFVRQYSLCGDPADLSRWRIAVLREPNGRGGSQLVHDTARAGLPVAVRGPRNHFELRPADEYVFVAGGIGITPLLPMVAAAHSAGKPWRLVYGGRAAERMSFVDELARYGEQVRLQPEDVFGQLDLERIVAESPAGTSIYACGPTGLLNRLEEVCAARADIALHVERFSANPDALADPTRRRPFQLIARTSGVTIQVPADKTIVEALEDAGVEVLTSCEEGICGTCETRIVAGVAEHHDSVLEDDERAGNQVMMICVSRAATESLTLEI
ncbi:Phenoxybenzoate dioxygenase subunit beta [Frankia canadensis]|uniref:Phenoxybenzoate dioxygenase subunit beta n=1 Tax=Frankia canadensis TaxID=1836972 RepID=A0A2I2KI02_9ACTN|nr:PDR/VanB family oxidoreductase [Frankia canadensis]SNQ45284.1 Phenoxybenzoate dioxygenase subunit beta [Frankia canadensis]SOU52574.1 Phenoxybenzoate dioxygenase subunit beta [Frankia canadensis]